MAHREQGPASHRKASRRGDEVKGEARHPIWRWIIHTPWVLAVIALLAVVVFFGSGAGNPLLSRLFISRLELMTGGKVEFRALSIRWFAMRATIKNLVIHGREPAGTEPLFTAEEVQAGLRLASIWGRSIFLGEIVLPQPHEQIPGAKNGTTNQPPPPPPASSNKPMRRTPFLL